MPHRRRCRPRRGLWDRRQGWPQPGHRTRSYSHYMSIICMHYIHYIYVRLSLAQPQLWSCQIEAGPRDADVQNLDHCALWRWARSYGPPGCWGSDLSGRTIEVTGPTALHLECCFASSRLDISFEAYLQGALLLVTAAAQEQVAG